MSKFKFASFTAILALSANAAQGAFSQGGSQGSSSQGSYTQTPGSYNQSQQSPYNQGQDPYTQNPASNQNQYYNQNQGADQSYYNNPNNSGSSNNFQSSPPSYQQGNPSQYNSTPQGSSSQFNGSQGSSNQPQSYNSKWGQTRNSNKNIGQSDDTYNTSAAATNTKYPQDNAATESDRQINAKIRDRISGWVKDNYKNVSLNTANGTVTIIGVLNSPDDQKTLLIEIRKIDGVRNIVNNTSVVDNSNSQMKASDAKFPQDRGATDADRQLNAKIRDKITGWFTDKYKNISLNTSNGVVTINGFVASSEDLTKLLNDLRNIDGIRSVNNNAQVKE